MRACLAISSYRYDESVLRLIERARDDGALDLFARVIVVDSIGTGRIADALRERFGERVEYHCAPTNLGSAGNLARRLELAARGTEDVVYAVNHDGVVERATVERLLSLASDRPRLGALYPLRRMSSRGGRYDLTGRWSIPVPMHVADEPPAPTLVPVWWSSSNPALYSLAPVRAGLTPWADLWMGWEDLGYGWLLSANGWDQFIVTDAITEDGYELRAVAGGRAYVTDKPSWYAYYGVRNLVLITRRTRPGMIRRGAVAARIAAEIGLAVAVRPEKARRLSYMASGIIDGLRGRSGKWVVP